MALSSLPDVVTEQPAGDAPLLATLRAGDALDGVFACTRKERLLTRGGTPYLALELRDRSGALPARIFRDADLHGGRFDAGELVAVSGRVARFREELQLELERIERATGAELDPARFLPVAYRDLDELDGFLEHLSREVYEPGYRRLLDAMLDDRELRAAWRLAPCTRSAHHAYLGGLLEHTVAVATLAQEVALQHPRLDRDLLLCAAVVHDIGKTREFTYGASIELSDEGRMVGHVQIGLGLIAGYAAASKLDPVRSNALAHCVLCHHGPDAAPAGRFQSAEALALCRINALDASIKGALEHGGDLRPRAPRAATA
jgi:3'-5' exoribonuclease